MAKRPFHPIVAGTLLLLVSVAATVAVVEGYCRLRLTLPPDRVVFRRQRFIFDPAELAKIREVPGMRQHSSFGDLPPLRTKPSVFPPYPFVATTERQSPPDGSSQRNYLWPTPRKVSRRTRLLPGKWRSRARLANGETIFDVEVQVDKDGRRETLNPNPGKRKKYLLVLGCSFVFGEGVRDDQTLSSRLAAALPEYRVYNDGISGNGPDNFLATLEEMNRSEIPQADGAAIYLLLQDHARRSKPSLSFYLERGRFEDPYYVADSQDHVRRIDGYYTEHWLSGLLTGLLSHSAFMAYNNLEFPFTIGLADFRRVATLAAEMNRVYRAKFGNDRFYVVIYPNMIGKGIDPAPLLGEAGVKYLDYGKVNLRSYTRKPPMLHPLDAHPSPEALALLGQRIAHDLFGAIE